MLKCILFKSLFFTFILKRKTDKIWRKNLLATNKLDHDFLKLVRS